MYNVITEKWVIIVIVPVLKFFRHNLNAIGPTLVPFIPMLVVALN
jgi:hypothetical protein